uniref:DUF4821 domain-containing protein n=1 Tax=Macrostomum lignano TaxID=282301 RepID=A0A1I8FTF4_9PLAT
MISAFEVAQFVNDEQSWRELADPRKFPLPPDLEPECELDIRPSQRVPEPTLLLVEFDQIVGQNILLTQPTLATSAVDRLNESLQVVFGVNYQEATAMSHFSIVPESTSVFPDIEFPTYMRRAIAAAELSVAHLPIRADLLAIYLANPDSLAERLQPDEIRTLALPTRPGLDSQHGGRLAPHPGSQRVRDLLAAAPKSRDDVPQPDSRLPGSRQRKRGCGF